MVCFRDSDFRTAKRMREMSAVLTCEFLSLNGKEVCGVFRGRNDDSSHLPEASEGLVVAVQLGQDN